MDLILNNELYKNLEAVNGAITYGDGNQGWFNPELTKIRKELIFLVSILRNMSFY